MAANFWLSSQCDLLLQKERKAPKVFEGLKLETNRSATIQKRARQLYVLKAENVERLLKLGKKLKLSQIPLLTACVYVHRLCCFYADAQRDQKDAEKHGTKEGNLRHGDREKRGSKGATGLFGDKSDALVALSCLYLACKVEEAPVTIERLLKGAKGIFDLSTLQKPEGLQTGDSAMKGEGEAEAENQITSEDIIEGELVVLNALCTSLVVHHPTQDAAHYARSLGVESYSELISIIIADSYHTDLCLHFPPPLIALGCIYMACGVNNLDILPQCEELNVEKEEVLLVASELFEYYKYKSG